MKIKSTGTWIAAAALVSLGCQEPARAVPPPAPEVGVKDATVETPRPVLEKPAAEEETKSCGADFAKDDARLLLDVEKMYGALEKVMHEGKLIPIIDGIRDVALRKAFPELDGAVEELTRGVAVNGAVVGQIARARVGAYATCMSLAEDDISWCTAQDESWEGSRQACQVLHTTHRRIALGAIRNGGDCASVMKGSPEVFGIDEARWIEVCGAIKDMKPDSCPSNVDVDVNAMCKAASARDGREHCKLEGSEHSPIWEPCCTRFAYRMAGVIVNPDIPGILPEHDALEGDSDGCERALVWGLFQDMAGFFGVEDIPDSPMTIYSNDDYLCRFQVYHSLHHLPGK